MHYVYKYVHEGKVLYIGKSDRRDFQRLKEHGKKQDDNIPKEAFPKINAANIYVTFLANSTMSDVVESELIRRYNPPYNKDKKSEWCGLDFTEPKWIPYRISGQIQNVSTTSAYLPAHETENERYDYYTDYMRCVEKISELEYQIADSNQKTSWLKTSYADAIARLKTAKEEIERLKKAPKEEIERLENELSLYKECLSSSEKREIAWMDLYNEAFARWTDGLVKYNNLLKRYESLKSNASAPNESVSFWQKHFAKRKETK